MRIMTRFHLTIRIFGTFQFQTCPSDHMKALFDYVKYSIYSIALKTDLGRCHFQETFFDRFTVIVHSPASVVYKFRNAHHLKLARSCWFILTFVKIFWTEKFEKKKTALSITLVRGVVSVWRPL